MKSFLFIVLSVILLNSGSFSNFIFAQGNSLTGLPIIKNYLPSEHGGTPQNWEIVKDKRGIIYFANTGGLLEYDGSNWRLIKVENEVARSVAMDSRGTIFVGGVDQFGLLKADTTGKLQYKSLLKLLPAEERNFGDIWTIWPVENGIYFQSSSHIFYLPNSLIYSTDRSQKGIRIWKSESVFSPAFMVDNKFYVPEIGKGLCAIEEDEIKMIKEGDKFNGITIYSMLSFNGDYSSDKRVLIGTESFWEGVDVPGEALEVLIIGKLPFAVPTDPIVEANTIAVENDGGNGFIDYTLPETIIRFRQGFGRLIRSSTDAGVVHGLEPDLADLLDEIHRVRPVRRRLAWDETARLDDGGIDALDQFRYGEMLFERDDAHGLTTSRFLRSVCRTRPLPRQPGESPEAARVFLFCRVSGRRTGSHFAWKRSRLYPARRACAGCAPRARCIRRRSAPRT